MFLIILFNNPAVNQLIFLYFFPSSSVALQRWIPGSNRGDEQAEAEQGKGSQHHKHLVCLNYF